MTAWDIEPGGVSSVLKRAGGSAERMAKAGQNMQETLPSAAASAGTIAEGGHEGDGKPVKADKNGKGGKAGVQGPVASALGVFARQWNEDLQYISRRAASSLLGAHLATKEYVEGDLRMAASRNRDAINGIVPDMPGVKGGSGDGGGKR
ncbi:DUF6507 family protein [Streptomyces flavofungini]|uniref:DUF6507 family protein n=1 Tax=Streptomyces flavofungini TaxID=68200 RepID=UPI0025B17B25|nr:DUF6507 family protein [Streptomyces flavofungini]WJV46458.1 DUF6507 family protein [Streptomyces flavofungini]